MTAHYVKQTWANGVLGNTPLAARRLNPIEQGIYDATEGVIALEVTVATLTSPAGIVQTGSGAPGAGTPIFPPIYLDGAATPVTTWAYNSDTALWVEVVSDLFRLDSGAPGGLTPTTPKFYIDSVTNILYAYDGAAWQQLSAGTPVQVGAGAPSGGTPVLPPLYVDNTSSPWNLYVRSASAWHLLGDGSGVGSLFTIDSGTPGVTTPPTSPPLYIDSSTSPYNIYAWDGAAWHLLGDGGSGSVVQFDSGTPGVTTPPTTPPLYVDTSTSPYEMYAWDGAAWNLTGDGNSGSSAQFGSGTPTVTTPPTTPPIYFDTSVIPHSMYAYDGAAWDLITESSSDPFGSSFTLLSVHGESDPSINSGGTAQDTLTGGVAYTVDFPNTALYKSDNDSGQDFQITDAQGADITTIQCEFMSPSAQVRIDEWLTIYGLAQGDSVLVSTWNKTFVQVDTSAVLVCQDTVCENQSQGTTAVLDSFFGLALPRISFILNTASTTIGVDGSVRLRIQNGLLNPDNVNLRASNPTSFAGDVSVPGQVTLSWTPGVGGGTVVDYLLWDTTNNVKHVATASGFVFTAPAGSTDFIIEARSSYGFSGQVSGTFVIA